MRVEVNGAKQTSRRLRKLHDRLSPDQQRWVFAQLLDDMYAIQRMWWAREFAGKRDKSPRRGNPETYMFQTGQLMAGATTSGAARSYNLVNEKFALLSVRGSAVGLAEMHRRQGRDAIADLSRRDNRNLTETMGRFIFAAMD